MGGVSVWFIHFNSDETIRLRAVNPEEKHYIYFSCVLKKISTAIMEKKIKNKKYVSLLIFSNSPLKTVNLLPSRIL
jgi:hypothetical protein